MGKESRDWDSERDNINRWTKNWWGRTNRKLEGRVALFPQIQNRKKTQIPTWLGWVITTLVGIGAIVGGLYLFGLVKL